MTQTGTERVAASAANGAAATPTTIQVAQQAAAVAVGSKQGHDNAEVKPGFRKISWAIGPAAQPFLGSSLSARDLDCLTTAVYYEARGEGAAGQAAVAQVVLNRVRHPAFPKSVCGVVYQGSKGRGCQFSFACNGAMSGRKEGPAWTRARNVATRAMGGFVLGGVGNATHFHATRVSPGWGGMVRVAQVGAHVFYRLGGKAGRAQSFRGRAVASAPAAKPAYRILRKSDDAAELTLASADAAPASLKPVAAAVSKAVEPAKAAPAQASPVEAAVSTPVATAS